MKNILIIGSTGQIGSELTMKLRGIYSGNVVAGYIPGAEPKGELAESGPSEIVDITNAAQIAAVVDKYNIDTIYNLAALLSAVADFDDVSLQVEDGVGRAFASPGNLQISANNSDVELRARVHSYDRVLGAGGRSRLGRAGGGRGSLRG